MLGNPHLSNPRATLKQAAWIIIAAGLAAITPASIAQDRLRDRAPELRELVDQLVIQLKLSYRDQLSELQRRHAELAKAIEAWNASPRTDADFELMASWLRAAIRASLAGSQHPLPPVPRFTSTSALAQEYRVAKPEAGQSPTATTEPPQPANSAASAVVSPSVPGSTAGSDAALHPTAPSNTQQSASALPNRRQAPPVSDDLPRRAGDSAGKRPPTTQPSVNMSLDNPFRDDPLPESQFPAQRQTAAKPVTHQHWPDSPGGPAGNVEINLAELRSRIQGYNLGLRRVEAELMQPRELSPARLAELAQMLNDLLDTCDFLELYLKTLPPSQRRGLPVPRRAAGVVEMLAEGVRTSRDRLTGGETGNDGVLRQRNLQLLQEADRTIANLPTGH